MPGADAPMHRALALARAAADQGEVPVGAVIVTKYGEIIASAHNEICIRHDPTAHAEMLALRSACAALHNERLEECDLYVTLEPCPMCAAAISFARIRRLYFGAYDPKGGGVEHGAKLFTQSTCHHVPEVIGGIEEHACSTLLTDFFKQRR